MSAPAHCVNNVAATIWTSGYTYVRSPRDPLRQVTHPYVLIVRLMPTLARRHAPECFDDHVAQDNAKRAQWSANTPHDAKERQMKQEDIVIVP